MRTTENPVVCDLDELCKLLTNSWPPRQQDSVTTDSDSTFARLGSTDDGEAIDDQFSSGDQCYETRMITMPHILQTRGPHCDPNSTATAGDVPAGSVLEKLGYAEYESYASSPGACALHVPVDCSDPSRALSDDTAHLGQDERATDGTEGENEIETQFGDAAMRVLETCEQLLSSSCGGCVDREHVLHEIGQLKKRYRCDLATRTQQASRCSIMRRSRRQERRHTLGMEARRVLKEWVDAHLEEPYPTIDEKHLLADATRLSLKQINDWFTNYRKRHWDESMVRNRQRVYEYTRYAPQPPSNVFGAPAGPRAFA